ncbi:hypothetical protein ACFQ88_25750 [Paenibacillus sp. NPDC056579]|uniref:hypothetical protein n=1 Tax=Paenibacillus sp. NPDC056579 TaxID=3345871 RepID=UPI0036B3526A
MNTNNTDMNTGMSETAQMAKVIEGYKYDGSRSNLSIINAYSASFKYWGRSYSHSPWLYGAIGLPFLFRVGDEVNSAPVLNELPYSRMVALLNNLGVRVQGISETAEGAKLQQLRGQAWEAAKRAIAAGYPCFGRGFDFNYGETSVVQGYDESAACYIISCWHDTKSVPAQMLGERDGLIDLHWMMPDGEPEDDVRTVREALQLAVEFADGRLTGPGTRAGSAAYEHWTAKLRQGAVDGWFFAYHTHEWDTCRTNGLKFLQKAKERLGEAAEDAIDDAILRFGRVRDLFHQVYELFPWEQPRGLIEDTERRLQAAGLLDEAKQADAAAIESFRNVANVLQID